MTRLHSYSRKMQQTIILKLLLTYINIKLIQLLAQGGFRFLHLMTTKVTLIEGHSPWTRYSYPIPMKGNIIIDQTQCNKYLKLSGSPKWKWRHVPSLWIRTHSSHNNSSIHELGTSKDYKKTTQWEDNPKLYLLTELTQLTLPLQVSVFAYSSLMKIPVSSKKGLCKKREGQKVLWFFPALH